MKKFILLTIMALWLTISAMAIDLPAGTYYFDNSTTKWAQPQLIVTNADKSSTVIPLEATAEEADRYQFVLSADLTDIENFYFSDGDEASLDRTDALTELPRFKNMVVFCPDFFTNSLGKSIKWGYWRTLASYGMTVTGTLPVLYINTDDGGAVVTKDEYKTATCYLDAMGIEGLESVGSESKPLVLQIKGRGNVTWNNHHKRPYRLKLDKKNSLLGMSKSKHYVLLSHSDDFGSTSLKDESAFEVSRRLGLGYTVAHKPIELVINGDYQGLYFLAEKIRVDEDHVNIVEQKDNETDPELITGGWLLEIDNTAEANQIIIYESDQFPTLRITPDTPEELSTEQTTYITDLLTKVNAAIYNEDKTSTEWENYIDIDALARYYLVYEIVHNPEAFHGSCYFYKDQGADSKFIFGPVWDFGNSFNLWDSENPSFIMDNTSFSNHWIRELLKYPRLQDKVHEIFWNEAYPSLTGENNIADYLMDVANYMENAGIHDYDRWYGYSNNWSYTSRKGVQGERINIKLNWLANQWEKYSGANLATVAKNSIVSVSAGEVKFNNEIVSASIWDVAGRRVNSKITGNTLTTDAANGIYLISVTFADGHKLSSKIVLK